nr:LPS O-antigen length regulator Wzz(fepE) [Escherichia coli]
MSINSASGKDEVDLIELINVLWRKRKFIFIIACFFAVTGVFVAFIYPYKWTSVAVVTPAESVRLTELEKVLTGLQVLGIDFKADKTELFNLFIKEIKSVSLLEEYLRSSSYVTDCIKNRKNDKAYLHRMVVALSERMTAVNDNAGQKKNDALPYTSWTLSFTVSSGEAAQNLLAGYINYVSEKVVKTVLQNVRDQLTIKTQYETERLAQDRIKLRNQLDAKIRRLSYSLEIAGAAGIIKPPYSNGQAIKDDPDYPISLGVDGIKRKLEIEKAVSDIAEINGDLLNRQYMLEKLKNTNMDDVNFTPFSYQARPSLPIKHNGPSKLIIVTISALIGFMVACVYILLRNAITLRNSGVVFKKEN